MTEYTAAAPGWAPAGALYRLLARYPLRLTLPALFLFSLLPALAGTLLQELHDSRREAELTVTQRVLSAAAGDAAHLAHAWTSHDESDRGLALRVRTAEPGFEAAVLVDLQGRVVEASDGKGAGTVFDSARPGFDLPVDGRQHALTRGETLFTVVPVTAASRDGTPGELLGYYYRRDRLADAFAVARQAAMVGGVRHTLGFVLVVGMFWWVAERVVRARLDCVARAAAAVSAGELHVRAVLDGEDELAQLAQAFNGMVATLERDRATLQEHATALAARNAELGTLRRALDAHAIVSVTDTVGDIVDVNDKFCEISGYARHELLGHNHRLLKSSVHSPAFYRELWTTIRAGRAWHGVLQNRRKDGSPYWVQSSILPLIDAAGTHAGYISLRTDITERERLRIALDRLALNDATDNPFDFFADVLGTGLDAHQAGVLRFVETNTRMRELGGWPRRVLGDEAPLGGCAAAVLAASDLVTHCGDPAHTFPGDPLLAAAPQGHLYAMPVPGPAGAPVGMVYALCRRAPLDEASMRALLGTLARRAAGEIQRQSLERAQVRQQAWLEFVIKGAGAGVWDWDIVTGAVHYNEQWAIMLGYRLADIEPVVGLWQSLLHPDDRARVLAVVEGHLAGETEQYESEHRLRTASGDYIWVLDRGTVTVRAPDGRALRMSGVHLDITKFKATQTALAEEQQRLQLILANMPLGLWELDLVSGAVSASPQWLSRFGMGLDQLPRNRSEWGQRIHPDDNPRVQAAAADYIAGRSTSFVAEYRIVAPEGWRWILSQGVITSRDEHGQPLRIIGVHVDVQEQREAEETRRENEARLQLVIKAGDLGVWDWRLDRDEFIYNELMATMLGYEVDALPTQADWQALVHPEDMAPSRAALIAHLRGAQAIYSFELRLRTRLGEWRWIASRGQVVERDAKGRALRMIGIHFDVNDRRVAQSALAVSEARLRVVLENSPIGIYWLDPEGGLVYINAALRAGLGVTLEEFAGEGWTSFVHADDRAHLIDSWRAFVASDEETIELEYRYATLHRGVRYVHARAVRTHVPGMHIGFIGTMEDTTDKFENERERERLQLQIQQAQKMEAIGQLAGGIAHDFNNILASVIGFGTLARDRFAGDAQGKLADYLGAVITAGERGRELVAKMLAFSRAVPGGQVQAVDPAAVTCEVQQMLSAVIPSSMQFTVALDDNVPPVEIAAVDLHQVLVNLVVNARDANGSHGRIAVRVHDLAEYRGHCAACRAPLAGEFVAISVRDDGCGMDPRTAARIFDPFFTTKAVGKGTGMGLSVVHGIVHRVGGHLLLDTAPGVGTTFTLLLRCAGSAARGDDARGAAARRDIAGLRVLVVDDEPLVRGLVAELLAGEGAEATLAADGAEAQCLFAADPQRFDVVFTDQTMPGLTGLELAAALREIRPVLPVVVYSGYSDAASREIARAGRVHFLAKPAEPAAIVQALHAAVDAGLHAPDAALARTA